MTKNPIRRFDRGPGIALYDNGSLHFETRLKAWFLSCIPVGMHIMLDDTGAGGLQHFVVARFVGAYYSNYTKPPHWQFLIGSMAQDGPHVQAFGILPGGLLGNLGGILGEI